MPSRSTTGPAGSPSRRKLAPKSIKNALGVFRTFLRWLRRMERIERVPEFPVIRVPAEAAQPDFRERRGGATRRPHTEGSTQNLVDRLREASHILSEEHSQMPSVR
jgi:hypothetical protein